MTFLHTSLLWIFIPLAVLPILLHLLTLHRLKTVELSTFRFLFDSYVQQRRRMRFLEALLAMLRTLFLIALIFMVCRPVIQRWNNLFGAGSGTGGREVILLVDCSASMKASSAGVPAIERARTAALAVVDRLAPEDRLTLIRIGAHPEEIFSRFTTDTRGIREKIEALEPSSARANLFDALDQVFRVGASRHRDPLVYLFTDCQASSWREVRSQGLKRILPTDAPFVVVNVGSLTGGDAGPTVANRAVVGDTPRQSRVIAGLPLVLRARIVNHAKTEKAELTLSLFIDDKQVWRSPVQVPAGGTLVHPIDYVPRQTGVLRGRFEITGKNADRFPDDDRFLFTLTVEPRLKVLLVNGNPSPDPEQNEGRYLHTALTSRTSTAAGRATGGDAGPTGPNPAAASKSAQEIYEVREVPETGLSAETLRDASVVILANCGPAIQGQFGALKTFVREGGGLLIFPGDRTDPARLNGGLFPVVGPQGESLTTARLRPAEGDPAKVETFERLTWLDAARETLLVFGSRDSDRRHFKTVRVYKRFKIDVGKRPGVKPNALRLAQFSNGAPALIQGRLGEGKLLLAAFPAHPRWTNLPLKPDFVPLILQLVKHVEHRPEVEVSPEVMADGTAEVAVSTNWAPVEVTVRDPAGRSTPQPVERKGPRLLGAFEHTSKRGYYTVEVRSGRAGLNRTSTLAFAVNLDPLESDFKRLSEKDLKELLPTTKLTYVDASAQALQEKGSIGKEQEIWPVLIWLLFVLIGVEFLLSTLGGKKEQEEDVPLSERLRSLSPGSWVGRMTGARGTAE